MESKPKKRQVRKVRKATQEPQKSQVQQDKFVSYERYGKVVESFPTNKTAEQIIKEQGDLIESLKSHPGWDIVRELIEESVASVSGRWTNGYYYEGELTRGGKNKEYLTGYQEALTQLSNRIQDFVIARDKMIKKKKEGETISKEEVYNPYLEEEV